MNKRKKSTAYDGRIHCGSGISVRSDVDLNLSSPASAFFPVIQLAVTIMSALSVIYMLQGFLNGDTNDYLITNGTVVWFAVILTAVSALISSMKQPFFKAIGIISLVINSIYIVMNIGDAVKGFMYTVYVYSKRAEFSTPLFAQQIKDIEQGQIESFLLALAFLLTLMLSICCIYYINFPIMFLETFPVFELGTFWGWEPYNWTVVFMVAGWIVILSISLVNHTTKKRTNNNTFAVYLKKKTFYLTNENIKRKFFSSASAFMLIITASVFAVTAITAAVTHNYRPENLKDMRRDLSMKFRDVTQDISDKIENGTAKIPGREKAVGGTNGGKLGLYNDIHFKGTTSLKVQVSEPLKMPLYLRGYSAENYRSNAWNPERADKSILKAFKGDGYSILDYDFIQYNNYLYPDAQTKKISIQNINANNDLIYAPYACAYFKSNNIKEQDFDGMVSPKKISSNNIFEYSLPELKTWNSIINYYIENAHDGYYQNEYTFYDDYIFSNLDESYLYVPDNLKPVLDNIIKNIGVTSEHTLLSKYNAVCSYFRDNLKYDTAPGITPEGSDFIEYFLTEQKKGYCTYFASAGVMFMRELGIPARYVEGYVIEPEQYSENENGNIKVTDRCAHAWCEVFIPGYGWYPLEFTNSYTEGHNPNLTDEERNIKHNDDSSSNAESKQDNSSKTDINNNSSSKKDDSSSKPDNSKNSNVNSSKAITPPTDAGNGKEGGADGEIGPSSISRTQLIYLGIMAVLIVIAALSISVRRHTKLDKLEKNINSKDPNRSVISCYTAFMKYISLLGISNTENLTDAQLSSRLSGDLEQLSPGLSTVFIQLSEPAITAYMSDYNADEEEAAHSRIIFYKAKKEIFSMLGFWKRIAAKWIHALY